MRLLDLLVPVRCAACGVAGVSPCPDCITAMRVAPVAPPPAGLASCRAAVAYAGPARALVAGLKYRQGRAALPWMADAAAAVAPVPAELDVVTWIPAARAHLRRRGFDQGRLLARGVGGRLGLPVRPLLRRGPGPPQTGRSLSARRLMAPDLSSRPVPGLRVLVVDDVWTTGASLESAASALRAAGAASVSGVTVARTVLKAGADRTEGNEHGDRNPRALSRRGSGSAARSGSAAAGAGGAPPAR